MNQRIDAATTGSGWVAAVVAGKLHASLLETDPDLLDGWLHSAAPDMLRQAITRRVRQDNEAARRGARVREFAEAAQDLQDADGAESREVTARRLLRLFEMIHVVDDSDTRKRACDMTGPEHLFVADAYRESAGKSLMCEAFHRAVAKKAGNRLVSEVLDADQYDRLYLSLTRKAALSLATTLPTPTSRLSEPDMPSPPAPLRPGPA
jgi:hypothetical protein